MLEESEKRSTLELFFEFQRGHLDVNALEDPNKERDIFFTLERLNPFSRDSRITLDETTHKYTVDGKEDHISVSTLVKTFFQEFNAKEIITKMKKSRKYNAQHRYWNMSDEEIALRWTQTNQEAVEKGKDMHHHIEKFYNLLALNQFITTETLYGSLPDSKEYQQFRTFHEETIVPGFARFGLRPYRTEMRVFYKKYKLAGTLDILFEVKKEENIPSEYILMDWKRCKSIDQKNDYGQKGEGPVNHLDDVNYNHYALNLSLYRYILAEKYNIHVSNSYLVVFHPDHRNYEMFEVPYYLDEIKAILNIRYEAVTKEKSRKRKETQ